MRLPSSRRSLWLALVLLSALQCTPDERQLREAARTHSVAEAGTAAGAAGAESESFAGEGGEIESAGGRLGGAGVAGLGGRATAGFAGAPTVDPGGSGTVNGGGVPGASGGAGNSAGGGGADAGGAPFDSPCGDIDHNAVDDCAETVLLNSRFDTDTTHWVPGANLIQAWDGRDARAKSGSGSILVTNRTPIAAIDAWVLAGTDQCIPVTERLKYELAARVLIPDGQGLGGAGLNLYAYTGDACSGIFLSGLATGLTVQRGGWLSWRANWKCR
ncbi:MAG: hypothetical protein WDO74_31795 [Pseudomonadota bacterium]